MRLKIVGSKTLMPLAIILAMMFIAWGDSVLPRPLSNYSRNTRNKLNQVLIGVFPSVDLESKDLNVKREKQIDKFEKQAAPAAKKD